MATVRQSGGGPIQFLFSPAILLMNRLRYAWKFILMGALLVVPFGWVAYLQYQTATTFMDFNEGEHVGVLHIAASRDLLKQVGRHRLLSSAILAGQGSYRGELAIAAGKSDAAAAELDKVDAQLGARLK